jgi:hypothetical protein
MTTFALFQPVDLTALAVVLSFVTGSVLLAILGSLGNNFVPCTAGEHGFYMHKLYVMKKEVVLA